MSSSPFTSSTSSSGARKFNDRCAYLSGSKTVFALFNVELDSLLADLRFSDCLKDDEAAVPEQSLVSLASSREYNCPFVRLPGV